ncbi:hypothetical protein ACFR99_04955 [Haloarchaeobius amylolyticus]|uniref:Amphi-Trp domain-containing protein n=1 Tax=Haloarchaeobius amylolyticus TaxID=1198296 RepID=A0ABD6BDS1_9EURY
MAPDERPTPPPELSDISEATRDELTAHDAATLRAVSDYLEKLAAWKDQHDSTDAADPETYPDGVPERATVSVTEIAGTEYYYYQWREGDEIRSKTVQQ